jgi:aerotaxis receptor
MRRNGQVTGHLSVRTKPTRHEIDAAEALYRRFKEGRAKGLRFHRGLVVHTGMMKWRSAFQLLPTCWRVRLAMMLAGSAIVAAFVGSGQDLLQWGIAAAFSVASLLAAALFIEAQITSPLKRVLEVAQQVASGEAASDLHLNRTDDLGLLARAINQAGLNLHSLVADVFEQASGVQVASAEIATATNDLSSRTEQTASNLEQTAAAMEQQTASVRQNADTSLQACQIASLASSAAQRGGDAVAKVVATMSDISASSSKVADIIGVIDGIAFQTNILALNAAVEAARAGEQGRGFAVVASEVRSLAGRSAAAAKEIKGLIDDSAQRVASGAQLVAQAGSTMTDVVQQVERVSALMLEITAASKEQSLGIGQVGQAVAQLDEMTQQNAAMVEQSSAAAVSMGDQAERLVRAVKVFSI